MAAQVDRVHEAIEGNSIAYLMGIAQDDSSPKIHLKPLSKGDRVYVPASIQLRRLANAVAVTEGRVRAMSKEWQAASGINRFNLRRHLDEIKSQARVFKELFYQQASADAKKPLGPIPTLRRKGKDVVIVISRRNRDVYKAWVADGEEGGASLNAIEHPWDH